MDISNRCGRSAHDHWVCEVSNVASFKQYQVVELTADFPTEGVARGTVGTIIEVYDTPGQNEAYEIEVADENGRSLAQFVATPQQLRLASAS
jgi:hypothetical protein